MILDTIAAASRRRAEAMKQDGRAERIQKAAEGFHTDCGKRFRERLAAPGLSFLCELKRASPSKGVIAEEFPYLDIARTYEEAGAAAVSCLTEPDHFLGSMDCLRETAAALSIPVLRKDFITDVCQIEEAALAAGADIIGINHRNLKDFSMDLTLTERLRPVVPPGVLCVAESGLTDRAAVRRMRKAGADAVLIGEMLMRAQDRGALLRQMIQENQDR